MLEQGTTTVRDEKIIHRIENTGFVMNNSSSLGDGTTKPDLKEARKQSIERCIESLVHACKCREASCRLPSCQKMKRVLQHTKNCTRKTRGGCRICKQLIALCCYHGEQCQETNCLVSFCPNIKQKLKEVRQRFQRARLLIKRIRSFDATGVVLFSSYMAGLSLNQAQPIHSPVPSMYYLGSAISQLNVAGKPDLSAVLTPPASEPE